MHGRPSSLTRRALLIALGMLPLAASADEAAIRQALEPLLGARIEGVRPGPISGLFEVHIVLEDGPRIIYTDVQGSLLLQGNVYEPRSGRNLTEERLRSLAAIDFSMLPLDQAVTIRRGNGKRVLALFSDPHCPACRQFEAMLQQVDDITVHIFMVPVIRPDLADHSRAVWCSRDRAQAWFDLVLHGKLPAAGPECADPVDKNVRLARAMRLRATPTLIFANGERHDGGMPAPALRVRLDEAARR
jgi:thiol:disulfide interchange protein DsbC